MNYIIYKLIKHLLEFNRDNIFTSSNIINKKINAVLIIIFH
uniref:Uncharacterized protein n=1 Tax=Digenea simplex TaxID=945030 RepID=A0A1Z1MUQ0_DIGSM|nr:hypothetical protein [Digenea simplex]ARW69531.1 hypothetical protein [Digenea simplex]